MAPFRGADFGSSANGPPLALCAASNSPAGGKALNHAGDNTMNFGNAWVAPGRDFAIRVCVNQSGDIAFRAGDAAVSALIEWMKKR